MNKKTKLLKTLDRIPADVLCAQDYEHLAHHFIPQDRLAYIMGGSGDEVTLGKNREAFLEQAITPKPMTDVSHGSTKLTLLGDSYAHPLMLAPVAYQTLVHPQGELETARAAKATDSCMIASTLSSKKLEDIAQHAGEQRWFQLYLQPSWNDSITLITRAVDAGYKAIVVTVDAAIQLPSRRAIHAGFQFPADIVAANLNELQNTPDDKSATGSIFQRYMTASSSYKQIERLIKESPLPVIVKGILNAEDAMQLQAIGAAGIIVSNHGGRTMDHVPTSLSALPAIRHGVGPNFPVLLDSGIRSGTDAFKAISQGADAVLIGRLQIYALSVAGALGVAHMIKLLREELEATMAITGCSSIEDIQSTDLRAH